MPSIPSDPHISPVRSKPTTATNSRGRTREGSGGSLGAEPRCGVITVPIPRHSGPRTDRGLSQHCEVDAGGNVARKCPQVGRMFSREQFPSKHRYAVVLHTGEPHLHVHLVVKAESPDTNLARNSSRTISTMPIEPLKPQARSDPGSIIAAPTPSCSTE